MTDPDEMPSKRASRKTVLLDAASMAGLAIVTLAFFWKIIFTNRVLAGVDLFAYFYPYRDFASEALREGRLPLWNPYLFMGAPLLANSQVAVLYPLHWPFVWLSAPKQIAWSIVLHIWLAGAGTYLFARRAMLCRTWPSLAAAVVYAFGGYLGAQAEHINQLNASAWLPWLLLCLEAITQGMPRRRKWPAFLAGCGVISLIVLAGHTQSAYIVLAGAGFFALLRGMGDSERSGWRRVLHWLRGPMLLAAMIVVALLLSASQFLPTLELSRLSVRSGGLPYREAVSFSLRPTQVLKALLPPLPWGQPASQFLTYLWSAGVMLAGVGWEPPFSEFVAYVGIMGLLLASIGIASALKGLRRRPATTPAALPATTRARPFALPALCLALLGLFLALGAYNPIYYLLYKSVPGIGLFRVPARWLLLYTFGMALLAAIGLDNAAGGHRPRRNLARLIIPAAVFLLVAELFVAGRKLAYNLPTAPAAYESMRSATAHLLADSSGQQFRFMSLSDILYDPGDLGDLQSMFRSSLSEDSVYQLVVASKMKEVLAYNLPLLYRLSSVDGYDGGLLPTARYSTLERLFLSSDDIWSDGRLRQQLKAIPPVRLLSLLNVRYIITDKMQDAWNKGVYYDLENQISLGRVELTDLPNLAATHLGVVTYLTSAADLPDGTPVAEVIVRDGSTVLLSATLRAGFETAEGLYDAEPVAHGRASVVHHWRDNSKGSDYLAVLKLGQASRPTQILVRSLLPGEGATQIVLRGISLIDTRTGTSASVSIDPKLKLVHSGDVKIYRNLSALPRAFVVHRAQIFAEDEEALTRLSNPGFDPAREVILAAGAASAASSQPDTMVAAGPEPVELVHYSPERIDLNASLSSPGYLVLTDAFYPGWQAEVDGNPAQIVRADVYFRAVALESGVHEVTFRFRPRTVRWGLGIGSAAWIGWVLAVAAGALHAGRKRQSRV
jgi:hypothetical protein